ncbi:MAG: N-acetyltransferase, partial [Bacillota bacterium]|nr:N-acetyltransferase [Bacillota bacterium]
MEHKKTYNMKELKTTYGDLVIEGPVSPDKLASLDFHEDLKAFRPAKQQQQAIIGISQLDDGRIIIA